MKFKTALFDLGGTLISYENKYSWRELAYLGCRNASIFLEREIGVQIAPRELAEKLLTTLDTMMEEQSKGLAEIDIFKLVRSVLEHFNIKPHNGMPSAFVDKYYEPTTEQIRLEDGAPEILARLKSSRMKIGLVSNSIFPAKFHREEMKRFGIFGFFDFTIFSSEMGYRKPNPAIFLKALELASSAPEDTIFIGDRMLEDIDGPQQIGIKSVLKLVDRRDYSLDVKPFRSIKNLDELEMIFFE